jgi:hypothetical protein
MTPGETDEFTSLLRAKEAELSHSLRNRDEIVTEKASEALDAVQLMRERDLGIRNLDGIRTHCGRYVMRFPGLPKAPMARVPALRGRYFAKTDGRPAVDRILHQVPGTDRSPRY